MNTDPVTANFTAARATLLIASGLAACLAVSAGLVFEGSKVGLFAALFIGMAAMFRGLISVLRGGSGMVMLAVGDTA